MVSPGLDQYATELNLKRYGCTQVYIYFFGWSRVQPGPTIYHHDNVTKIDLASGLHSCLTAVHSLVLFGHFQYVKVVVGKDLESNFSTEKREVEENRERETERLFHTIPWKIKIMLDTLLRLFDTPTLEDWRIKCLQSWRASASTV